MKGGDGFNATGSDTRMGEERRTSRQAFSGRKAMPRRGTFQARRSAPERHFGTLAAKRQRANGDAEGFQNQCATSIPSASTHAGSLWKPRCTSRNHRFREFTARAKNLRRSAAQQAAIYVSMRARLHRPRHDAASPRSRDNCGKVRDVQCGVENVADFGAMPADEVRKNLTVTGLRTHAGLPDQSCLRMAFALPPKKVLAVPRSSGSRISSFLISRGR